jgi:hypothetical protein
VATTDLDIANASGFPLQIAVEELVRVTENQHHWKVLHREHAWSTGESSGFIDLVLTNSPGTYYLAVECKRVRDASWIFLPWNGEAQPRRHVNAWVSYHNGKLTYPRLFGWHDLAGEPSCPEGTFCALKGQDSSGQRSLLERVGGELVQSTEAFAEERRDFRPRQGDDLKVYACVIVTTARLAVARFKPEAISLADGTLTDDKVTFEEVPFIRFRKQLAARDIALTSKDYEGHRVWARENTVFVVRADALVDFLTAFEYDDAPLRALCR